MPYLATVQILFDDEPTLKTQDAACIWMSELLEDNPQVISWNYLRVGAQTLRPLNISHSDIDFDKAIDALN
jgi:hypothetical protein